VESYPIDAPDRASFKHCRRAWDLGARARRNFEAATPPAPPTVVEGVMEALAVYYFPGMWDWNRAIVLPLVHRALDRAASAGPEVHAVLDRYAAWAAPLDRFTPVRVAADLEVNVPDPFISDRDVATEAGAPVRYTARADAVVWTEEDQLELLCHRVGPFTDPELLSLDEGALTTCWAWAHLMLDDRIAMIAFNEICLDDATFRRTHVPVSRKEVALAGRQLGVESLDMLDNGRSVYPNPTPAGCAACAFRHPCRAMREGEDPEPILSAEFRQRAEPVLQEGRLGGQTWSMNRGARPQRFND